VSAPALALLEQLGTRLLAASALAAALALGVALLVRWLPSLPPAARAGLWWLVAARTLVELAGAPPLELALLPVSGPNAAGPLGAEMPLTAVGPTSAGPIAVSAGTATMVPSPLALAALVGGVLALVALAAGARQLARVRRSVRRAAPVEDAALLERLERAKTRLGVRREVRLARCADAATPQVAGLLRPTILLPAASGDLGPDEIDCVLAHELAHVRRWDALWALVPFAAERLLVFHPLVRWAAREYALATEAACDALVLERCAPPPDRYGRLLVRLAASPAAPAAAWPLARRPLKRRLDMLSRTLSRRRPTWIVVGVAALVALAIAVPVRLVAQAPEPPPAPPAPAAVEAPAAPEAPPAPPAPGTRWSGGEPASPARSIDPEADEVARAHRLAARAEREAQRDLREVERELRAAEREAMHRGRTRQGEVKVEMERLQRELERLQTEELAGLGREIARILEQELPRLEGTLDVELEARAGQVARHAEQLARQAEEMARWGEEMAAVGERIQRQVERDLRRALEPLEPLESLEPLEPLEPSLEELPEPPEPPAPVD